MTRCVRTADVLPGGRSVFARPTQQAVGGALGIAELACRQTKHAGTRRNYVSTCAELDKLRLGLASRAGRAGRLAGDIDRRTLVAVRARRLAERRVGRRRAATVARLRMRVKGRQGRVVTICLEHNRMRRQPTEDPSTCWNVPCGQASQVSCPAASVYRPGSHSRQDCCPVLGMEEPGGHSSHCVAPGTGCTLPAAQGVHSDVPVSFVNVPAAYGQASAIGRSDTATQRQTRSGTHQARRRRKMTGREP